MLHPSLHGYLAEQRQRELERAAGRERMLIEARAATADAPSVAERTSLALVRLLIGAGMRLSARYPTEAPRALLPAASYDRTLSPLNPWTPAMAAHVGNATESRAALTFVYYGFVTVGPHSITRAEYAMPLAYPIASRRPGAEKRG